MDDTHGIGLLDATASRKRRSSILKSQRPPRTPLTELELNVATPPDTTKSRRVSFSRRTGVAEFITDEATNTWKTIYVEQNKSMESSLNDSAKNPPKQTVGHLGKRIFQQQFQEEEFYNFGNIITSHNPVAQELNMSLRGNLTQQFAELDRDLDGKNVPTPQNNFELSSLTDHKSKIFADDVTNPTLAEVSNKIDINLSSLDAVGAPDKCYDLDEIEKDLKIPRTNTGNRHFTTMSNLSEQIEIDLNMKPAANSDDFDMSITDTVRNPQVEDVLHNYKTRNDKKSNLDNDWTLDKENVVMNPYVTPKETINFAINEVPEQVLVFDGKRLTIQSERKNITNNIQENDFNKTLISNEITDRPPQRKTIVLNLNDDLPNFIDVPTAAGVSAANNIIRTDEHQQGNNDGIYSTVNVISNKTDLTNSHKTIIYDSGDIANISVTQAIITNILLEKEKRKTIVFDNYSGELSMTQALPSNVLASECVQHNKTIVYDVDNVSITQAVPINLLLQSQTIANTGCTPAVPQNMMITNKSNETNKRKTIIFHNENSDISITKVLPSNILLSNANDHNSNQKDVQNLTDIIKATLDRENTTNNNIQIQSKGDKIDKYDCNKSETEIVSLNIENKASEDEQHRESDMKYRFNLDTSITEVLTDNLLNASEISEKFDVCNISVTQAVPSNIIMEQIEKYSMQTHQTVANIKSNNSIKNTTEEISKSSLDRYTDIPLTVSNEKKVTKENIALETIECCNMSMTQVLPTVEISNQIIPRIGTIVYDNDEIDITDTRSVPKNILMNEIKTYKDNTLLIFENMNSDQLSSVSASEGMLIKSEQNIATKINTSYADITSAVHTNGNEISENFNSIASRTLQQAKEALQKSLAENNNLIKDMSIDNTRPLSEHDNLFKSMNNDGLGYKLETKSLLSTTEHKNKDVFVYQAVTTHNVSKHQGLRTEQGDVKSDRTLNRYDEIASKKSNAGEKSEASLLIHDVSHYTGESDPPDEALSKSNPKKSILAQLLNMSGESLNMSVDGMDDKNVMVGLESEIALEKFARDLVTQQLRVEPAEPIDASEEAKIDTPPKEDAKQASYHLHKKEVRSCVMQAENIHRPPLTLSYEQENNQQPENEEEKVVSSNSDINSVEHSNEGVEVKDGSEDRCIKEADDTKELLEMLEDFTDKTVVVGPELEANRSSTEIIDVPIDMEEKTDVDSSDSKDSCGKLQSDVEVRQPSLEGMEGIESEEYYTNDATDEDADVVMDKEVSLRRKSSHVSRDVVKTLHFDESNDGLKCNSNYTPLQKTAPVDVSSSKDSKAKVIPTFLNDVSDGLKSLMQDLVKPSADLMPYHVPGVERIIRNPTTTTSKELQTNIITSSQIDIIDVNTYPVSESNIILARQRDDNDGEHAGADVATSVDSEVESRVRSRATRPTTKQVLIFDHKNPLNNVILCPSGNTDIHRYTPKKSEPPKSGASPDGKDVKIMPLEVKLKEAMECQRISTHYNIETNDKVFDGAAREDRETYPAAQYELNPVATTEVNTLIAMKCNRELLQASSSLTLVDEEVYCNINKSKSSIKSPVKVIFKLNDVEDETVESSFESSDADYGRAQKRNYYRAKYDHFQVCAAEVTPRPLSKMQKLSSSPQHVADYRTGSDKCFNKPFKSDPSKRCAKSNLVNNTTPKVRTTTIVHHVTVCKLDAEDKDKLILPIQDVETSSGSTLKTETISRKDLKECTSTELTSFTSSNAMKEMEYMPSLVTVAGSGETLHTDTDDCSDVMSQIESLSFMGSRECEWEGCEPDAWRFLLLRRRLRLTVRVARDVTELPPPALSARPDTPVISITIEPVHQESDAVTCASVRLACEAMRYECVRCGGESGAAGGGRGVGALLRRCVGGISPM